MTDSPFPAFFDNLPQPDVPMDGLWARMMVDNALILFYSLPEGGSADEHTHGDEWGAILDGKIDITMNGETRTYAKGDTYFIPAGTPHSVVNHPGVVGIDVFADPDRFPAKR
jgi:quercetin dioxygenase-like cupin family protein